MISAPLPPLTPSVSKPPQTPSLQTASQTPSVEEKHTPTPTELVPSYLTIIPEPQKFLLIDEENKYCS